MNQRPALRSAAMLVGCLPLLLSPAWGVDWSPRNHHGADIVLADGDSIWGLHYGIRTLTIPTGCRVTARGYRPTNPALGQVQIQAEIIVIHGTLDALGAGYTGGGGAASDAPAPPGEGAYPGFAGDTGVAGVFPCSNGSFPNGTTSVVNGAYGHVGDKCLPTVQYSGGNATPPLATNPRNWDAESLASREGFGGGGAGGGICIDLCELTAPEQLKIDQGARITSVSATHPVELPSGGTIKVLRDISFNNALSRLTITGGRTFLSPFAESSAGPGWELYE